MFQKKLGMIGICLAVIITAAMILSGCSQPAPKPAAFKWPDPMVSAALDVGSGGYLMAAAMGDAAKKERNVTFRVIPAGTDISRLSLLANKRAHVAWIGFGAHTAQEGVLDFGGTEWGPQSVRIVTAGLPSSAMFYAVAKDAGIKTWADLKGKRVAWVIGYPSANLIGEGSMAFGGLTWKDVKRVDFPSFGAAGKGVVEGKVDAACAASYSSWVYELEASPRGLALVPYPHSDKEGWKKLQLSVPVMQPIFADTGPGLSKDKTLETGTYPNPSLVVYDWADEELAYQMAKLAHELWPVYSVAKIPGMEQFDPARRSYEYSIPYHPGAIRFYKEIGKWTDAAQKNNDRLIQRQKLLRDTWDKAIADASVQKVASDKFLAFWDAARIKALEAANFEVFYRPSS